MMPDEYLPPNKILFLQNLPESVTKDQLMGLFSQYVRVQSYPFRVTDWRTSQIPQLVRSTSHSDKKGHRLRRVHGRGKRDSREGRATQLQVGWREQDQSELHASSALGHYANWWQCRSHLRGSNGFMLYDDSCSVQLTALWCITKYYIFLYLFHGGEGYSTSKLQQCSEKVRNIVVGVQYKWESVV